MDKYKKELKDYVASMRDSGYTVDSIKQQLSNHGHASKVVEETIIDLEKPEKKDKNEKTGDKTKNKPAPQEAYRKKNLILAKERLFIFLYLLGVIAFIFWLSHSNEVSLGLVALCFSPAVISMLFAIIVLETHMQQFRSVNWILPILAALIFYVMSTSSATFKNVDVSNLTVANFIVAMGFIIFIEMLISTYVDKKTETKRGTVKRKTTRTIDATSTATQELTLFQKKKQFEEYIQSIEDKAKAINFAIGRVYSNKHGGSPKIRDAIKINAEWYNQFSKITEDNFDESIVPLKKSLWSIYDRLLGFEKKEKEVFTKTEVENLSGLERNREGNDKIIDVITANDKDPVPTYYQSAIDFCRKATDQISGIIKK